MDGEEVDDSLHQLDFSGDEMEEDELLTMKRVYPLCGMEGFLRVVAAYREFRQ